MNQPIRVLNVLTIMDRGGAETMVMNYYRNIDRSKVQFDFLVHRDQRGAYDDEIESMGGKIYRLPRLNPWSGNYRVALNRFFEEHTEYRIVHVHQDCMSSVILKVAEHHHRPVCIARSHSTSQDKNIKYPVKIWYKRSISKYATDLFACGKDAGDWMFAGAPYQIVHNAIDVASHIYDPAKQERIRAQIGVTNHFVVGHVGRFNHPKNHSFLLKIFTEGYLFRGSLGEEYTASSFTGEGVNIFRVLVCNVPLALSFLYRKELFTNSSKAENLAVNLTMLNGAIMFVGLFGTANYFARLANYFLIFQSLSLPWMLKKIGGKDGKMLTILMVLGFVAYFYYANVINQPFDQDFARLSLAEYLNIAGG